MKTAFLSSSSPRETFGQSLSWKNIDGDRDQMHSRRKKHTLSSLSKAETKKILCRLSGDDQCSIDRLPGKEKHLWAFLFMRFIGHLLHPCNSSEMHLRCVNTCGTLVFPFKFTPNSVHFFCSVLSVTVRYRRRERFFPRCLWGEQKPEQGQMLLLRVQM